LAPKHERIVISKKFLSDTPNCIRLGFYEKQKLPQKYNFWLTQFKMSDGTFMVSEQLLMVVARIIKKDYEDLWNIVYMYN